MSFLILILDSANSNQKEARKEVSRRIKIYKDVAHETCGLDHFSQGVFVSAVNWFKGATSFVLKQSKYSENPQIRKRFRAFVNLNLGIREKKYIAGDLD